MTTGGIGGTISGGTMTFFPLTGGSGSGNVKPIKTEWKTTQAKQWELLKTKHLTGTCYSQIMTL